MRISYAYGRGVNLFGCRQHLQSGLIAYIKRYYCYDKTGRTVICGNRR